LHINKIHILHSSKINHTKWDAKVSAAPNGLIYATTIYLNTICDNWYGLIVNDYEVIAALPYRRKGFITYWYTPPFIQQLGFNGTINSELAIELINVLKSKYAYGTITLNFENQQIADKIETKQKLNYTLDLSPSFSVIKNSFRKDLQKNIEKAIQFQFEYINTVSFKMAIDMYRINHGKQLKNIHAKDYNNFEKLCGQLNTTELKCFTRAIIDKEQQILAVVIILQDNKRFYNILNTSTKEGKSKQANHLLYNYLLNEFAKQNLIFDFEGSTIPGIGAFYAAFGAREEKYFTHHYNQLPFPLSLIN
jgi:hypothetical protein